MSSYYYPLGTKGKLIGVPFVGSHTNYGNWESDEAIDIAAPVGTPVYAVASGTIGSQFGFLPGEGPGSTDALAGQRLHLVTSGDEFYYAHLSSIAPGIHPGSYVNQGQLLGYSGSASGVAHLHLGEEAQYASRGTSWVQQILGGILNPGPAGTPGGLVPGANAAGPTTGGGTITTPAPQPQPPSGTGTGSQTPTTPDPNIPPGAFQNGTQCAQNSDCLSGNCTDVAGGKMCAPKPFGFGCGGVIPQGICDAIAFLFSLRFLEVVGGGFLVLLGLYLVVRQMGGPQVPVLGTAAKVVGRS